MAALQEKSERYRHVKKRRRAMNVRVLVLSMSLSLITGITRGQEAVENEAESETKNDLGVFVGALFNPTADETGPSIGVDFTRELTEVIGLTVVGEFAKAGEREALFVGGLQLRPGGNFKVLFAPGVIVEKNEDEHGNELHESGDSAEGFSREIRFVARLGVGYSFELSTVVLTPVVYFDLLEGVEDAVDAHFVYGLTIGFPF
jgi:hypothetical protein